MAGGTSNYDASVPEMSLPEGFEDLEAIENMELGRLKKQPLVNVFGVVKTFQPPMSTKGSDCKCTVEIIDNSTPFARVGTAVNFFAAREMLPQIDGVGIVLRLEKIKVQMRNGRVSLLTNKATKYSVLPASELQSAFLQPKMVHTLASKYQMSPKDMSYAIWLRHNIPDGSLSNTPEFQGQTHQARSSKDKYSALKDLKEHGYYNLLGEVIKKFEGDFDKATVHLSDYTAHPRFYDHERNADQNAPGYRDGDEYGYTSAFIKSKESNWPGPYGKLTIQLTLFDEHAKPIKDLGVGQWVFIRNVHAKMGKDGVHLEGFLHGGMGGVSVVEKSECSEEVKMWYEEGLRNKKKYEESFRKKELAASTISKKARKLRRKEKQAAAAAEKKIREAEAEAEARSVERLDLNEYIKCSNPSQPALPLTYGLDPQKYQSQHNFGPHLVRKFRAHVRVIDFFPDKLEDFAYYNELLDEWNWGFSLRVEDGSLPNDSNLLTDSSPKSRVWLVIDNPNAQFLLSLDADNLRQNDELLTNLRERLCILWGDLEERKSAVLEKIHQVEPTEADKNETSRNTTPQPYSDVEIEQPEKVARSKRKRKLSIQSSDVENGASRNSIPPLYSESEEESIKRARPKRKTQPLTTRDTNEQPTSLAMQQAKESILAEFRRDPQAKNKAFTCCIRESGIEDNTDRILGMFETKIAGD